jgi:hypothetical protein
VHGKIGDVRLLQGLSETAGRDNARALAEKQFNENIRVSKELREKDPENTDFRHGLAIAYESASYGRY